MSEKEEWWDAYDRDGRLIAGVRLLRGQPIADGLYHLVSDVIVRHTDGEWLLMQRDPSKPRGGGQWEGTAGGSALVGESAEECAKRELAEETGIVADTLTLVGQSVNEVHNAIHREYLCIVDCAKDSVTLQEGETTDYRWVTQETLVAMRMRGELTKRTRAYVDSLAADGGGA